MGDDSANGWHCADREKASNDNGLYACDDASDCGAGLACCESFASAAIYVDCTARRGGECRVERCVEGDEAGCPAGQACVEGECASTAPKPPTRCGAGPACRGATPLCQVKEGRASCVSREAAVSPLDDSEVSLYACTRPADCRRGEACCSGGATGMRQAFCSNACDRTNQLVLCASAADCRRDFCTGLDDERHCRKAVACVVDSDDTPPWLKSCHVR